MHWTTLQRVMNYLKKVWRWRLESMLKTIQNLKSNSTSNQYRASWPYCNRINIQNTYKLHFQQYRMMENWFHKLTNVFDGSGFKFLSKSIWSVETSQHSKYIRTLLHCHLVLSTVYNLRALKWGHAPALSLIHYILFCPTWLDSCTGTALGACSKYKRLLAQ